MNINSNDRDGHVLFPSFGLDDTVAQRELDKLIHTAGIMRSSDAQLVLQYYYQSVYGIYNHDVPDPNRPMAVSALHDKENFMEGGFIFSLVRKYNAYDIQKISGLDVLTFLELPYFMITFLLDLAKSTAFSRHKQESEVSKQLDLDL